MLHECFASGMLDQHDQPSGSREIRRDKDFHEGAEP